MIWINCLRFAPAQPRVAHPDAIDESRFICLGADPSGRILITVFAPRGDSIRIISSRKASRAERRPYEKVR
jgi:uncharacterized DUF497 family protein